MSLDKFAQAGGWTFLELGLLYIIVQWLKGIAGLLRRWQRKHDETL
jgi:hypothetical protein